MPQQDLRDQNKSIDPLAPFKVLAVMCRPSDLKAREAMVGLIHSDTGVGRQRRRPLTINEFYREVALHAKRGVVAGGLLLTLLQLSHNNEPATLNRAIPLVSNLLPRWEQPMGPDWSKDAHVEHHPHSRRKTLAAFRDYRSVSHLWAALIHGGQNDRDDIWPGSTETLPVFLSYAKAFAEKGRRLRWSGRDRRFTLNAADLWSFTLPSDQTKTAALLALPLDEAQRRLLNDL